MPKIVLDSKTGVVVRPGELADAEQIHAAICTMGAGLGAAGKISSTVEDFRCYGFGPYAAFTSLIAEVDDRFAGLALFFPIFSTWLGKPGVYVRLAVDRDNVAAQRFYDRLGIGWIEADRDHGAYGDDFARLARINQIRE